MSSPDRFKPYGPDVEAVVRLDEALPPEHPVHVFVDLVRSVDLGHFVIPPGPKGEKPYHPHALFGILAWGYLHGVRSAEAFGYDAVRDVWVCPADKLLVRQVTPPGSTGRPSKHRYRAAPDDCATCPLRARCLKPGEERRLLVAQRSRPTGAMRFKLRQPDARRRYARRKTIVEPVFGQLKEVRGFTTLSLRGLARAAGEYLLACLAHNFGKLLRVCPLPSARMAPAAA